MRSAPGREEEQPPDSLRCAVLFCAMQVLLRYLVGAVGGGKPVPLIRTPNTVTVDSAGPSGLPVRKIQVAPRLGAGGGGMPRMRVTLPARAPGPGQGSVPKWRQPGQRALSF